MKIKKEIVFVITICLFGFSYLLDYFAGALRLNITSPLMFLTQKFLMLYPMTFVALTIRSVALMVSVSLILSLIEGKYSTKIVICLFTGFIAEVYAFQQLATGARFTPVTWTLSIAYGGALLIIPIIFYILAAITNFLIPQRKSEETHLPKKDSSDSLLPTHDN